MTSEVEGATATQTAETPAKKKGVTKAKAKKAKAKLHKPAKKEAKKNAGKSERIDVEAKIQVLNKEQNFRGKREKCWKALRSGMTVGAALDAIEKIYGYRTTAFIQASLESGLIKLSK